MRIAPTRPARAASLARHVAVAFVVLVVAACSGGGCSSCGGVTPLADGFPEAKGVENAASLRLMPAGLQFLQTNLGTLAGGLLGSGGAGGILTFDIPNTTTSVAGITATICPNGSDATANPEICVAEVDLGNANLSLSTASPYDLHITGTLPLRLQDLQVSFSCASVNVAINGDGSCPGGSFDQLPVDVDIAIHVDTNTAHAAGYGYSLITVNQILDQTAAENNLSSNLHVCGLPSCDALCCIENICSCAVAGIAGSLSSTLVSALYPQIESTLSSQVDNALCQKATATAPCPAGSTADSSMICRYDNDPNNACVATLLGTSGHASLASLLASISPGTVGGLDFIVAGGGPDTNTSDPSSTLAWGDLDPVLGGMTLGMVGGAAANPQTKCAPLAMLPLPTGVPIPNELLGADDTIAAWPAGTPGPDLALALSGRYVNYALAAFYNSGGLCLGVTTDNFQELNSGTLSLLAPSLKNLAFNGASAAVAVTTRPQTPPTVAIGNGTNDTTDPLLLVSMKDFAIDFYLWNDDRFIRVFTYTADLTIPVNLTVETTAADPNGALAPTIGTVSAANASVTNSELLFEKPASLAAGLTGLLGSIVGQLAGSIKPIDLSSLTSSLGVSLVIPSTPQVGLQKLTSGTDDFIAIFGGLALPPAGQVHHVHPRATLVRKTVHPEAMALDTYDPAKLPALELSFGAEAVDGDVEYAWWVDQGARSAWSSEPAPTIQGDVLYLQGKHTLYVTARTVGVPASEAESPVAVPYAIDVLPPNVTLSSNDGAIALSAWDFVSAPNALTARTRTTDTMGNQSAWSDWDTLSEVASRVVSAKGSALSVQVRDEEGNVAGSEIALIRGQNDVPAAAGACGCSAPGLRAANASRGALLAFAIFGLVLLRRRARAPRGPRGSSLLGGRTTALVLGVGAFAGATNQGCSCGGGSDVSTDAGDDGAASSDGGRDAAKKHDGAVVNENGCGVGCDQKCEAGLPQGWVGSYTSIAKASDGTLWLAGYNEKVVAPGFSLEYGDLVVGKYDTSSDSVDWVSADGLPTLPSGTCATYDPAGWRRGLSDPGDDVGLWTSIQLDASDHPVVSYYDVTHTALKFASSPDGQTWKTHTVMQATGSDIGRYSKMLVVKGVPVVVFLVMEPGTNGKVTSRVVVATSSVATPASASDWSFEDAAKDETGPCRSAFCAAPSVCVTETETCTPPSSACVAVPDSGTAACASPTVCVSGADGGAASCGTPIASPYLDLYPEALGDYVAIAPTSTTANGFGVIVYDRLHGALVQLAKRSGGWEETVLDSETGARASDTPDSGTVPAQTGDTGVGASLAIASNGDWHVSYVNGTTEALQYLMVPGGTGQPAAPEIVDDGYTLDGTPYPDGLHIVGDDSSISVDGSGTVTITYQDATAGTLHVATGTPASGGGHTWKVVAPDQTKEFAGYFSHAVPDDPTLVENFWLETTATSMKVSGGVTFLMP